jgi:3'-5' exoribonuclease
MKNVFIKELKPGTEFSEFFVLRKKELKDYEGQKFLKLELGDKTGRIDAILWEDGEKVFEAFDLGEIVKVKGFVTTYKEQVQIKVDKIRKSEKKEFDLADFLPASEKNLDELLEKYKSKALSLKNLFLRKLWEKLFEDKDFLAKLNVAPAAKLWHHSFMGGLLEHSLMVADICEQVSSFYELVDRELLISGALLHDIGKITEYQVKSFIDFTDEGRLLGHIVLGDELIYEKIKEIKDFPAELALKLRHLILSHQGELEFGSPVVPQTIEAIILHFADEMDSKAGAFTQIIKKQRGLGKKWSDWVPLISRYIYMGSEEG